jgi:hypothetical protein
MKQGIACGSIVGDHLLLSAFDETMSVPTIETWAEIVSR